MTNANEDSEDARLTRGVVGSVMAESRRAASTRQEAGAASSALADDGESEDEMVRELERELLERVKQAEHLEHRARQSDAEIGRLEQRLTEANLDLETNREVAESAEGRTGVLDEEISEWRQHAEGLRGELGERTRELEQRAEALERTKSELAEQTQKSEEQAAQASGIRAAHAPPRLIPGPSLESACS